ncbi:flavin-binding monooxygenase-like protein [Leptospira broomii serovar Hurstbridge str. 5399]|uniref:Flavin-containing monooxygenase 5 n=1 Tax=Leptospira broomii serovar Hurstbridge str. 5399 TaxID=1049789 RepID=T0F7X4_9LEPT|nr:NAD(P)-binding domain-containing protein [Leptospira broomii]EQA47230.1 flavin-binding monooxygenase-like protein [Leptospira broomii serovar Hurstbridge str. 5399]
MQRDGFRSGSREAIDYSDFICIVGAGPAGLSMGRSLKSRRIPFHIIERHTDVGGIWDMENPGSPMYKSAHFISSKYLSNYADFPMPSDYPDYPSNRQILAYHRSFAREYDLYPHIEFNASVENIEKNGSKWLVDLGNGELRLYGGIVCATGITWSPNFPKLPGSETFRGEVLHSVKYKDASLFKGKRVLIVGAGNSGCDIACDAGANAEQAFISVRRGYHFIPKHVLGQPADVFGDGAHWIPNWFSQWVLGKLLRFLIGDVTKLGLPAPDHKIFETHPIVNDQLLHNLRHGDVIAKGDIERLNGNFVEFKDGTREKIDMIVLATGYNWSIPYMDQYFEWKNGRPTDLYLTLFHRKYENLYVLGFMETDGGAYKMFDEMANIIAAYIEAKRKGEESARRFQKLIESDHPLLNGGIHYLDTGRHAVYVNQVAYRKYLSKMHQAMNWPQLKPRQFDKLKITNSNSAEKVVGASL